MENAGLFMALQPRIIACGKSMAAFSMAVRFLTGPAVMAASSIAVGLRGVLLHVAIVQASSLKHQIRRPTYYSIQTSTSSVSNSLLVYIFRRLFRRESSLLSSPRNTTFIPTSSAPGGFESAAPPRPFSLIFALLLLIMHHQLKAQTN